MDNEINTLFHDIRIFMANLKEMGPDEDETHIHIDEVFYYRQQLINMAMKIRSLK